MSKVEKFKEVKKELKKYAQAQLIREENFIPDAWGEIRDKDVRKSFIGVAETEKLLDKKFNFLNDVDTSLNDSVPLLITGGDEDKTVTVFLHDIDNITEKKIRDIIY